MQTNLIGQYVIDGWHESVWNKIIAVTFDRELVIWARNPDGHMVQYPAESCRTTDIPEIMEELRVAHETYGPFWSETLALVEEVKKRVAK